MITLVNSRMQFDSRGKHRSLQVSQGDLYLHNYYSFQYVWEDKEYVVYYITYQDPFHSPTRVFYILFPRTAENVTSDGHCSETDALILAAGKWTSQLHEEIFVFDDGDWNKSKDLYRAVASSSWEDVILSPDTKKSLIEDVHGFFDNRKLYAQFNVPWKRGIILHGVPGNGKTVSIKALMSSLYTREKPIPSLYVKTFETNCNTKEYSIKLIFWMARSMAPCILIFEDLDSLVHDDIRSYFLNEVDGLESNDGILMIGSTNHLDKLDPAIAKRPSRFDRKYHFKIPGPEERKGYAEYWRAKLVKNEGVDFPDEVVGLVAELTEGFSFAYMKELFVMSLLCLVRGWTPEQDAGEASESPDLVEEEKKEEKEEEEEEKEKEEEMCSCKARCKTCNKPLPSGDGEKDKKAAEEKEGEKEARENKLVLKEVEVPEHLKDNLLLRVIQHQIKVLHAEMDNSTDEGKGEKVGTAGGRRRRRGRGRRC